MTARPASVSGVPQRSPLRYPGGKTWMFPQVRRLLCSPGFSSTVIIEPFAGGAVTSLSAVAEGLVRRAVLVERDDGVAAFWRTVLGDHKWLVRRILGFRPSRRAVLQVINSKGQSRRDLAFRTLVKNRFNYGGILAGGATLLRSGEGRKGLASRWYPETISKRIADIASMSPRFRIVHGDGTRYMPSIRARNAVLFVDPPYTAGGKRAGRRLYEHNVVDHERVFDLAAASSNPVIMTYDDSSKVRGMARSRGLHARRIPMMSGHHAVMHELLITNIKPR